MGLKESLGSTLKNFARIFPGISDYQSKENLRGQDKVVREHLAELLNRTAKRLDELKMRLIEAKKIKYLGRIEIITKKIAKLSDIIKHASYGYSPVFAEDAVDEKKLKKIYDYDISIAEEIRELDRHITEIAEKAGISMDQSLFIAMEQRIEKIEVLIQGRKQYA